MQYHKDYVAWSDQQALLLEQKRWEEIDLVNLVEEVRDLGNKHRDALESQLIRLLVHLLKCQYQPDKKTNSCASLVGEVSPTNTAWLFTIKDARKQIKRLIRKHPVLGVHLERAFEECYVYAREDASDETELAIAAFPSECPFQLNEVLDSWFFPDTD